MTSIMPTGRKPISDIRKKLYAARKVAGSICPFFYKVLTTMPVVITPDVPVMAVDKVGRLYVNENNCATRSKEDLAAILIHEVYHLALSHAKRREDWVGGTPTEDQRKVWNIAADLAVNQLLARDTKLPADALTLDSQLPEFDAPFKDLPMVRGGLTTETYVGLLAPHYLKKKKDDEGEEGDDKGGEGGGDDGRGPNNDPDMEGSASDGVQKPWEKPFKMSDLARQLDQLKEIEKAVDAAPGSAPGALKAAVSARLRPQPDPFRQLQTLAAKSVASPIGAEEPTYARPARRPAEGDVLKKGVRRVSPECAIIVDTSGSMQCGDNTERALVALAAGLRKVQRPKVVCFDATIQARKRIQSLKQFSWEGGGGTNMGTAVTQVDKEDRPDAIVVLTDGETRWCPKPRARVIIALTTPCPGYPTPEWAKVVHLYKQGGGYES